MMISARAIYHSIPLITFYLLTPSLFSPLFISIHKQLKFFSSWKRRPSPPQKKFYRRYSPAGSSTPVHDVPGGLQLLVLLAAACTYSTSTALSPLPSSTFILFSTSFSTSQCSLFSSSSYDFNSLGMSILSFIFYLLHSSTLMFPWPCHIHKMVSEVVFICVFDFTSVHTSSFHLLA